MSYDEDEDFALSDDDDDEDMSPDTLQKESPNPVKKPAASSKQIKEQTSLEESTSFDMTDFKIDDTEPEPTTTAPPADTATTQHTAPPGSIESIISQVTSKSPTPVPTKTAPRSTIKNEPSSNQIMKKQNSTSSVPAGKSSKKLIKKEPSVSKIGKKNSFQEKSAKKEVNKEDRAGQGKKLMGKQGSRKENITKQASVPSFVRSQSDASAKKEETNEGDDYAYESNADFDDESPTKTESVANKSSLQQQSDPLDDQNAFEKDDVTDSAATATVTATAPISSNARSLSKSKSMKRETAPKKVERKQHSLPDDQTLHKEKPSNRNLKKEFSAESQAVLQKNRPTGQTTTLQQSASTPHLRDGKEISPKNKSTAELLPPQELVEEAQSGKKHTDTNNEVEDNAYAEDVNDFEDEGCGEETHTHDEATAQGKSQDIANSVIVTPQKSCQPPQPQPSNKDPEAAASSVSSSPKRIRGGKKTKEELDLNNKISELDKQIRAIAAEREKCSPVKKISKKKFPKLKKGGKDPKARKQKATMGKKFVHSKLKFIMADISISPYMTAPDVKYSKETLRLPEIIRNAKFDDPAGKHLPFDEKQMENKFINEVYNYKNTEIY